MIRIRLRSTVRGEQLRGELARAGLDTFVYVEHNGEHNELVLTNLAEAARADAEAIVAKHAPAPPEPSPDEELRRAIAATVTLADLKAALLGANSRHAVAARSKGTA
jgi:hypothetical protein